MLRRFLFFFIVLGVFGSFFCVEPYAGNQLCAELLGNAHAEPTANDFLLPRPGFLYDTSNYRHQGSLGGGLEIRDQGAFGSCWAHSGLRIYELRALKATGKYTPLSADYLLAMHLVDSSLTSIRHHLHTLSEGADVHRVAELVHDFGFLPSEVWTPRISISHSRAIIRRLMLQLHYIINYARMDYLRLDLKDLAAEKNFFADVRKKLIDRIEAFTGPLPQKAMTFEWEGQTFTPQMFYHLPRYTPPNPHSAPEAGHHIVSAKNQSALQIFRKIQAQLDTTGEPVSIGIQWEPTFIDSFTGVASIDAFFQHQMSSFEDRELIALLAADASGTDSGPHSMIIIDYALDENGNPLRLLAMNSHGEQLGDEGYIHIFWDYFETFIEDAYVLNGF